MKQAGLSSSHVYSLVADGWTRVILLQWGILTFLICHIAGWSLLYLLLTAHTIVEQLKVCHWNKREREKA